jgi:hypothetical protein
MGRPVARGLRVPLKADSVEGPVVTYGKGPAAINFLGDDGRWGRVTFEKLDAIRICRGEHDPYDRSAGDGGEWSWVSVVADSPWLRERFEYEKRHYENAYEFGGDVNEMIREFSHYVFHFHDQFVEALSAGIWFEVADAFIGDRDLDPMHPALYLPASTVAERFEAQGITCQVRRNPRAMAEILADAAFGSQKLLQIAAELDGSATPDWTLSVRVRGGRTESSLRSYFGKIEARYDGVPELDTVRPRIEAWLAEVRQRRMEMGKT